ncbi:hypothetical protein [Stenotrophomonas sp. BIGb0135]|uniref:hypothetical protein n=1 Tax=Stenotrophomonas sp. BIGb0135 TaxID=2940620 RepID=UPI002169A0C6|nr:hypothetical protein [Stenotrophomonas sp. BIGb0135]MCS4236670.1 hypothetical protein [Stenotrophomonas sp. BIGb0135]
MTDLDFSGLTIDQRRLMDAGGWTADGTQAAPSRPAAQQLVRRGLLEAYPAVLEDDHGSYGVTEYYVPLNVRAAWLEFKSRLPQRAEPVEDEP